MASSSLNHGVSSRAQTNSGCTQTVRRQPPFSSRQKLDGITFRLVQHELRDLEQRIRTAGHLDLAGERFDTMFAGQNRNGQFRQRRRLGAADRFATIIAMIPKTTAFAVATAKFGTTTRRTATTITTAAGAITTRTTAFTGFAAETALGLDALVAE